MYKPIAQGEAFGEQFIAIAYDFLPECFAPTGPIFGFFCQTLLLDWRSRAPVHESHQGLPIIVKAAQ